MAANLPARRSWLAQRLASFFVLFNPTREVDDRAFTVWNDEMTRLLIDLPHDLLAFSIDQAIRSASHGFMPSVGEIRRAAEPLLAERTQQIERLQRMEAALSDPVATAERARRRQDEAAHARATAGDPR
ncbi:hypothetical protein [Novosphingobium sp. HII-3]|uniref:hypothetical protein n=1 Tax=Novosphingobium sp. HII-3 TaxID=2075565 RepID=UPI0011AFC3CF|nr:hypothetical protein [Novosphingobium sp. HII-3]